MRHGSAAAVARRSRTGTTGQDSLRPAAPSGLEICGSGAGPAAAQGPTLCGGREAMSVAVGATGAAGLRVWSHTGGYVCETRPASQSTPDGSWELFCRCSSTAVLRRYCRGGSKHWGEDRRLTRLAQTGVLDWDTSVARGGAEGTARKAGAGAPTEGGVRVRLCRCQGQPGEAEGPQNRGGDEAAAAARGVRRGGRGPRQ